MNVLNRKMFANRDARRKLASMGGIVASSDTLLGTAQRYAPGGQAEAQEQYVVIIPGVIETPVKMSANTLARLQASSPEIMANATILDRGTAAAQGIDVDRLRPGDAFVPRRVAEKSVEQSAPAAPAAPAVDAEAIAAREARIADDARQFAQDRRSFPQPLDRIVDPTGPVGIFSGKTPGEKFMGPGIISGKTPGEKLAGVTSLFRREPAPTVALGTTPEAQTEVRPTDLPIIDNSRYTPFPEMQGPNRPIIESIKAGASNFAEAASNLAGGARKQYVTPELTGLESVAQAATEVEGSDESIRARVAESAQRGMRAGQIADAVGRPILEVLDIGAGLIGAGALEGTAFALDVMSAFQSGVMGNRQAGEFYAGLATDVKGASDDMYYSTEDQLLPRVSTGLTREGGLLYEPEVDERALIEAQSMTSPTMMSDTSDEPFVEELPDLTKSILEARKMEAPDTEFNVADALPTTGVDFGTDPTGVASVDPDIARKVSALAQQSPELAISGDATAAPTSKEFRNQDAIREYLATSDFGDRVLGGLTPEQLEQRREILESEAERALAEGDLNELAALNTIGRAVDFLESDTTIPKEEIYSDLLSGDPGALARYMEVPYTPTTEGGITTGVGELGAVQEENLNRLVDEEGLIKDARLANAPARARQMRAEEARIAEMTGMPSQGADLAALEEMMKEEAAGDEPKVEDQDTPTPDPDKGGPELPEITETAGGDGAATTTESPITPLISNEGGNIAGSSDPSGAMSKAIASARGKDPANMSLKERTMEMKSVLDELLGYDDKEKQEEFWLNMAMIGFGIAAGEDESALKNIADGLLAGASQMTKQSAARKEREDRTTLTAFGEALAQQRAEEKFQRDLTLAGIRASGSSDYGKRTDPLTLAFRIASDSVNAGEYDTLDEALVAAKETVSREYGVTFPNNSGSLLEGDVGSEEVINGVTYVPGNTYSIGGENYVYNGGGANDIKNFTKK